MRSFEGRVAVVTGGGSGMGRELARQLTAEGCHVATCDVSMDPMMETQRLCEEAMPADTRWSAHRCDVSIEEEVEQFRDAVLETHGGDHIDLLFNNAGIGGGGSFIEDSREDWDKTFGVCWGGVYYCCRAFMPLLVASREAHIVNTSSVNGFWASLGPGISHTAYSAAKFAVKGFSEALITDLRLTAPHVKVSVVMPGHIGTSIAINTGKVLGKPDPPDLSAAEIATIRVRRERQGLEVEGLDDDQIRAAVAQRAEDFRDSAPLTPAQAATIILDGVRDDRWRILVGEDAARLDELVRQHPEEAYEESFVARVQESGHLQGVLEPEV